MIIFVYVSTFISSYFFSLRKVFFFFFKFYFAGHSSRSASEEILTECECVWPLDGTSERSEGLS